MHIVFKFQSIEASKTAVGPLQITQWNQVRLQPFRLRLLLKARLNGNGQINRLTIYIHLIHCIYTVTTEYFFCPCFHRITFFGAISNKPFRIHVFVSSAILMVFSFNELRNAVQMCRDFEKTRSMETLAAGIYLWLTLSLAGFSRRLYCVIILIDALGMIAHLPFAFLTIGQNVFGIRIVSDLVKRHGCWVGGSLQRKKSKKNSASRYVLYYVLDKPFNHMYTV